MRRTSVIYQLLQHYHLKSIITNIEEKNIQDDQHF